MRNLFVLFLVVSFPFGVLAQAAPAASDLRKLVAGMQKVAKPSIGQPLPPKTTSALASFPLPLLLNGTPVPLDSLNRYSLAQVASVTLTKNEANTAIYGASGSWGVIEVKLKKN